MPLPGGPADKLGNRYENWWTVWQLVRMLQGASESIRIEDPGVDKAEFVLTGGGVREWHQAKRSHPTGQWTLTTLAGANVKLLQAIGGLLNGNTDRFVFVSSSDARELAEVTERARGASTLEEFETKFISAKKYVNLFAQIRQAWKDCDAETAYCCLQRIEVRTIDERTIEDLCRTGITAIFLGSSNELIAALRTITEDSVHKTIMREELIAKLATRGFSMRRIVGTGSALAMVESTTRQYLESVRGKLIRRILLPRPETQVLLNTLGDRGSDVVLTGRAGGGKTACVIELVDELQARHIPVLALRLDRMDPASTAVGLGREAGFEESPALVLAAAAEDRGAVLVIDQLDAISTASGRGSGFFDAIDAIFTEVRGLRERANIHVVVVCREFDWENDRRLKKLVAKGYDRVSMNDFPLDSVRDILAAAQFSHERFAPQQLELLRLPQNLSLFLDAEFDPTTAPVFNTAAELFDRYWNAKRRAVLHRARGAGDHWMDVIGILVEEMTRSQQLSVPRDKLDAINPEYLDQMFSEGVLTFDDRRFGFGHESFFDYCFARTFRARRETLVALLTSNEQHIFRRSQVRQVLAYLRDIDRARYLNELNDILTDERVRVHIKDMVFALLGSVSDPSEDEWNIWEIFTRPVLEAIEVGDAKAAGQISALGWLHFFQSSSWFVFSVENRSVERWLMADGPLANMAVSLLRIHARHAADMVAELLEEYADRGGDWPNRLRSFIELIDLTKSRRLFDLALRLIDKGVLDDVNSTFWTMLYEIGKHRPQWVSEFIAHWSRRRIGVVTAKEEEFGRASLFGYDQLPEEPIVDAANQAPSEFVQHVMPVVLEISDLATYVGASPPKNDKVWPLLIKGSNTGVEGACLQAMGLALTALARSGHDLRLEVDTLRQHDTYISNHLLQLCYTAAADRYADEAAEMLAAEPWRFECGYSDSPYWTSTQLVMEIAPRCSADVRTRLEAAILAYDPPVDRRHRGFASFSIFSALPPELRSESSRRRFGEYERKFGKPARAPRGIRGGIVKSPIPQDAVAKMTDEQWLSAISKYDSGYSSADLLTGGAEELARSLEARTAQEPERFAILAQRLPPQTSPSYLNGILAGIKTSRIADELKLAVCRKVYADARDECGRSIATILGTFRNALSEEAFSMLVWLATEHPNPACEAWQIDTGNGQNYFDGDIYMNGINTTRGHAAEVVSALIWRDVSYLARFRSTLESMVDDPSTCVRSCVARTLCAVAYHDTAFAVTLFGRLHDGQDLRLLASAHAYNFIKQHLRHHSDVMQPIVQRMLKCDHPEVAQAGARLVGLAVLSHEAASELGREVASGSIPERRGLAEVAAANIAHEDCRTWCEDLLVRFFDDTAEDVRKEAATGFRCLKSEPLERYERLINAFLDSISYCDDSFPILSLLNNSDQRVPGIACRVCEKFLGRFGDEARDVRTSRVRDAYVVTELVFRIYHQHQDDEWTIRALDLVDRLCLEAIGDARGRLDAFER